MIGIILTCLGLVIALLPFKPIRNFLRKCMRVLKSETTLYGDEIVPFRCPIVLRPGSDFLQTLFSDPIREAIIFEQLLKPKSQILILGQAGLGKSQLISYFEMLLSKDYPKIYRAFVSPKLRRERPLEMQIASQFKVEIQTSGTFKKGEHSIILIDGLDEMRQDECDSLFREVTKWIGQGSSVLSTARSIDALPALYAADYDPFTVEHLNDKQAIGRNKVSG
jgi:hypothetical protein